MEQAGFPPLRLLSWIPVTYMVPSHLHTLFWDVDVSAFEPSEYPDYTILRVLELGDQDAVRWLRSTFSEPEILGVLRTERRLSRKSANFWALVYGVPADAVAALHQNP
jgi:hypothetical protein